MLIDTTQSVSASGWRREDIRHEAEKNEVGQFQELHRQKCFFFVQSGFPQEKENEHDHRNDERGNERRV